MVFSSIIFLGLFLPVVFGIYCLAPRRLQNHVLLLASIIFYAWGETRFVALVLVSILANFWLAKAIHRGRRRRTLLAVAIGFNLLPLFVFKYGNFFVDNLHALAGLFGIATWTLAPIALPIGISFYTFHAISYLIDIYRRNVDPNRHLGQYGLYILYFPQLIAGPIIRYKDIHTQLPARTTSRDDITRGIVRFTMGLAKKVLIANELGQVADAGFDVPAASLGAPVAWLCLVCYAGQIYFDFSGYSDMAIGLARMFGFRFPENFNYPYSARSLQDFWRRWHITLSTWFRDYVYIPLGGNRGGRARTLVNLWLVFLLTGLWHGASWNFVVWGAIHGSFLIIERLGRVPGAAGVAGRQAAQWLTVLLVRNLYTMLVVMLAWVFFRASSLPQAIDYVLALAGHWPDSQATVAWDSVYSPRIGLLIAVATLLSVGAYRHLSRALQPAWQALSRAHCDGWARAIPVASMLIASLMSIALGKYNPFIYFRF